MKGNDDLPLGYSFHYQHKVLLPDDVIGTIQREIEESRTNFQGSEIFSDEDVQSRSDDLVSGTVIGRILRQAGEVDKQELPEDEVVIALNPTQANRVGSIVSHFKKSTNKLKYSGGQIDYEERTSQPCLQLKPSSEVDVLEVIRVSESKTRSFDRSFSSDRNYKSEVHNALDLYLHAYQSLASFEFASGIAEFPVCPSKTAKPHPVPIPYSGDEPPLRLDPPLFETAELRPSQLNNCLVLGSTGSGKTASCLWPLLEAMLDYRVDGKAASILVIDPKVELLELIRYQLMERGECDRLVVIGQSGPVQFFDDSNTLSIEDKFEKIKSFVSRPDQEDGGRWQVMAERFLLGFLRDDALYTQAVGVGLLQSVASLVFEDKSFLQKNQWVAIRAILNFGMESTVQLRLLSDLYDVLTMGVGLTAMNRPYAKYVALKDSDQLFYNSRGALLIADILGSVDLESLLDASLTTGSQQKTNCKISSYVERGSVIVFQPRKRATDDMVGAMLKSIFFRSAFERTDMHRPLGYFADEAQRFITTDAETGEHSVFDIARAYRLTAVIATQSIAALKAAVGRNAQSLSALESIFVNTPTKVCFRTTDTAAIDMMRGVIPVDSRGLGHVLNVRPPGSLPVGECYYVLGHQWGRYRYQFQSKANKSRTPADSLSELVEEGLQ